MDSRVALVAQEAVPLFRTGASASAKQSERSTAWVQYMASRSFAILSNWVLERTINRTFAGFKRLQERAGQNVRRSAVNSTFEHAIPTDALSRQLLSALRRGFSLDWDGIHGVRHWGRVRRNGLTSAAHEYR